MRYCFMRLLLPVSIITVVTFSAIGQKALPVGQIVVVPLRNQQVLGIVQRSIRTSETKNISR